MPHALQTVQSLVAPVVMISANGLLCLAFYNRMAAVSHRAREINKERFELGARLAAIARRTADPARTAHLRGRVETLDELGHRLMDRVRLVRDSLVCLLVSVLFMLACSLALGLASLHEAFNWGALGCFVAGAAAMGGGVVRAVQELRVAPDALGFEHQMLERMAQEADADSGPCI